MFQDFGPIDYPDAVAPGEGVEVDDDGLILVDWPASDHAEAGRLLFGERGQDGILPHPGALGRLVYSLRHGCWLRLDDVGIWREEPKARVRTMAEEWLGRVRIVRVNGKGETEKKQIPRSDAMVRGILNSGRDRVTLEASEWPTPPGVVWADGVLTGPDLVSRPLTGYDGATYAMSWPCPKGPVSLPLFDAYTASLWGDSVKEYRMIFYQWLGATLAGQATKYQRALLLYGRRGRGKSVLLEIVKSLFPAQAQTGIEPGAGGRFDAAGLARSQVNVIFDVRQTEHWAEGWFKSAVVGDTVDIERKGVDRETIKPKAGWIMGTNFLPDIRDPAVERRIVLLHCDGQEYGDDNPASDPNLAETIRREEGAGIVWRALEHFAAMRQLNRRYSIPALAQDLLQEARRYDPLISFLEDVLVPDPGRISVTSDQAYEAFVRHCKRVGNPAMSGAKFGTRLREAGVAKVKRSVMFIVDRRLMEPEQEPPNHDRHWSSRD